MKVGDKVNYVPHPCHAHQFLPGTGFPWVFGWKTGKRNKDGTDEVVELNNEEVRIKLNHVRRQSPERAISENAKLVMLRPNGFWSATITALNEEGGKVTSVNLDIKDGISGATLHYRKVTIDDKGAVPHTCHEIKEPEAPEEASVRHATAVRRHAAPTAAVKPAAGDDK